MENTTKERILDEALVCFAESGYNGTNLRDLAARLGLSKSALYKHYTSKDDIWNALIDRMEMYYSLRFGSRDNLPPVPQSCEELYNMTMHMLDFTLHDRKVILTRRILLVEQFRDERAKHLATLHFLTVQKDIFTHIFASMIDAGLIKNDDPEILALAYTAPITELIHLCDREPTVKAEAVAEIEKFVRHFIDTYAKKEV